MPCGFRSLRSRLTYRLPRTARGFDVAVLRVGTFALRPFPRTTLAALPQPIFPRSTPCGSNSRILSVDTRPAWILRLGFGIPDGIFD